MAADALPSGPGIAPASSPATSSIGCTGRKPHAAAAVRWPGAGRLDPRRRPRASGLPHAGHTPALARVLVRAQLAHAGAAPERFAAAAGPGIHRRSVALRDERAARAVGRKRRLQHAADLAVLQSLHLLSDWLSSRRDDGGAPHG